MSDFPAPGGSCLVCYQVPINPPMGYVRSFDVAPSGLIVSQFAQMFQNGQRRLVICVPYFEGGDTFALDSSTGQMTVHDRVNLINLIQLARGCGFGEFVIEMIPEWSASYANWLNPDIMGTANIRAFEPIEYYRDLAFTFDVWQFAQYAAAGSLVRMNLIGEGADVKVCERMWSDWCDQVNGHAGSIGFSMVPVQSSIDNYSKIYTNGIQPPVLGVSAYNGPNEMDWPTWKQATAMWPQAHIIRDLYT